MRNRIHACTWLVAALALATGCNSSTNTGSSGSGPSMEELAAKLEGKAPAAAPITPATTTDAAAGSESTNANSRDASATEGSAVPDDAKRASDRGPIQSRPTNYLGVVSRANRNIRERLDDVSWKTSVKLFEAEKGYKPRNTQEFLERVNGEGTRLPRIEEGNTYLYVPEEGQFGELYQVPKEEMPSEAPATGR